MRNKDKEKMKTQKDGEDESSNAVCMIKHKRDDVEKKTLLFPEIKMNANIHNTKKQNHFIKSLTTAASRPCLRYRKPALSARR